MIVQTTTAQRTTDLVMTCQNPRPPWAWRRRRDQGCQDYCRLPPLFSRALASLQPGWTRVPLSSSSNEPSLATKTSTRRSIPKKIRRAASSKNSVARPRKFSRQNFEQKTTFCRRPQNLLFLRGVWGEKPIFITNFFKLLSIFYWNLCNFPSTFRSNLVKISKIAAAGKIFFSFCSFLR